MRGFVAYLGLRTLRGRSGTARYLRGSVLGIALSLVPLLVVMVVSTGMIEGITARLLEVGTSHVQASLPPAVGAAEMQGIASLAERVPGVTAVVPERQGTALLVSASGSAGVTLRCIAQDAFARDRGLAATVRVTAGSLDLSDPGSVLLSASLARTLGVSAGDGLAVLSTLGGESGMPRITRVRAAGIFETGYQDLDRLMVFASLAAAGRLLSPRESRALLGVKVLDPFGDLEPVVQRLQRVLPADSRLGSWRELEYSRLASFQTTRALLLFIMGLVVLVAAVNVSSSVLMIVYERRFDIGILKAIGAGQGALAGSFLAVGAVTGAAGAVLGVALGLLAAVNVNGLLAAVQSGLNAGAWLFSVLRAPFLPSAPPIERITLFNSAYYLQEIPVRIDPVEIFTAALGTILLAALASWIPARRAARLKPLEVLRKV